MTQSTWIIDDCPMLAVTLPIIRIVYADLKVSNTPLCSNETSHPSLDSFLEFFGTQSSLYSQKVLDNLRSMETQLH